MDLAHSAFRVCARSAFTRPNPTMILIIKTILLRLQSSLVTKQLLPKPTPLRNITEDSKFASICTTFLSQRFASQCVTYDDQMSCCASATLCELMATWYIYISPGVSLHHVYGDAERCSFLFSFLHTLLLSLWYLCNQRWRYSVLAHTSRSLKAMCILWAIG